MTPKRYLHPDFREAVLQSMANAKTARLQRQRGETPTVFGIGGTALTKLAYFTHQKMLWCAIHADTLAATWLMTARLQLLAYAVGYKGEIFDEKMPPVIPRRRAARSAGVPRRAARSAVAKPNTSLLSPKQCAQLLKVSYPTMRVLIANGTFPIVTREIRKHQGRPYRRVLIDRAELQAGFDAWVDERNSEVS